MKQGAIVKAYKVIEKIAVQDTSLSVARNAFKMQNALKEAWEFQIAQEDKIFKKHPKLNPQTMQIHFENDEEKAEAVKEVNEVQEEFAELADMEQDVQITPFSISESENIRLSAEDIRNLQGFVEITE